MPDESNLKTQELKPVKDAMIAAGVERLREVLDQLIDAPEFVVWAVYSAMSDARDT